MRPDPRAFSDEVDTGSSKKMRPNKKLERRSDSIGSKSALGERIVTNSFASWPSRSAAALGADLLTLTVNAPRQNGRLGLASSHASWIIIALPGSIGESSMSVEQNSTVSTFTLPRRASFEGSINFPGPVVIEGSLIGEIRSASVVINERGIVEGTILAGSVTVLGEVNGAIYAVTLILKTACSVHGNIFHRHLSLENGCYFEGKSRRYNEPLALASA